MLKLLIICVFVATIHSNSIEWFNGRWLPVVMYTNQYTNKSKEWVRWSSKQCVGLWAGSLLETPACGWLDINSTNQRCTCGDRDVPIVQLNDSAKLKTYFYDFHMNEPRPIIVVDSDDEVDAGLSAKCKCGDKEMTQLVFRKTSGNYLVSYENKERKERKERSPSMTLVMVKYIPNMDEVYRFTKSPWLFLDMKYKEPILMCDPILFDNSAYVEGGDNVSIFRALLMNTW